MAIRKIGQEERERKRKKERERERKHTSKQLQREVQRSEELLKSEDTTNAAWFYSDTANSSPEKEARHNQRYKWSTADSKIHMEMPRAKNRSNNSEEE